MKDDQRITLTKRLLKDGLLRLMETKPIDKIGVSELCAESGINRSTFYRYYQLPRDLLMDIERDIIDGLQVESWEIRSMRDVSSIIEKIFNYMESHAPVMKILLRNNSDEQLTRIISQISSLALRVNSPLFPIKDMDEDSVRLCAAYTAGGIYFLMREWLLKGLPKTAKEVTALVLQCINAGAQLLNTP